MRSRLKKLNQRPSQERFEYSLLQLVESSLLRPLNCSLTLVAQMYFNGECDKFGRPIIYMKPALDNSTDRVIKVLSPSYSSLSLL